MKPNEIPSFDELCKLFNYTPTGRLLRNDEAAAVLCMKPNALNQMRYKGDGPRYLKPSRFVLYAEPDLLAYLYTGISTSDVA
jgi:hypothetical protein